MPFLSQHLLLDLPFYNTMPGDETRWPDTSATGLSAIIQGSCTADTIDRLGTCLKIGAGGHLILAPSNSPPTGLPTDPTLPGLDSLKQRMTSTQQLTIEFWAEPTPGQAYTDAEKILLSGPINVWTQGNRLFWQWSQGENLVTYQLEAIEGLHHWAIVINAGATSPEVLILRDGTEAKAEPVETPNTSAQRQTDAPLVIGAPQSGWIGKLAHLRIWATALSPEQVQQHLQRDITAHAAFKATTGLEWRLLNGDNEPSLYIYSSRQSQDLHVEIENTTQATTLLISLSTQPPSATNYQFQLVFRPGTIAAHVLEAFAQPQSLGGWSVSYHRINDEDCFSFLRTGDEKPLPPGEKLTLVLPNLAAEPGAGSRTTQVMLRYKGIELQSGETTLPKTLDGHRAQVLNIFYRSPFLDGVPKPPLEVGVVGAPVVLNNGQPTSLTLYIKNNNRNEDGNVAPLILGDDNVSKYPQFGLEIDTYPDNLQGLGDSNDLGEIEVKLREEDKAKIHHKKIDNSASSVRRWLITFKQPILTQVPPKIHLRLNQITDGQLLADDSDYNRNGRIQGILQVVDDKKFGKCIKFDGQDGNYISLSKDIIPSGREVTFSFWTWGADDLPVDNEVVRVSDAQGNRIVSVHLPWSDGKIYFDCGNLSSNYDRIQKSASSDEFKGSWTHWAFTKNANKGEMIIYRDGVIWHSGNGKGRRISSVNTATLGSRYKGKMAHFRSYDRALSIEEIKLQKEQDERGSAIEIPEESIIYLPLKNIVVKSPPGRSIIRLCYKDIYKYGEGFFEIPIDRVSAVPVKVDKNGQGYGLALGHDPRTDLDDPNAPVLDQMLSVRQVGNGGAVRIDNSGTGVGLTVDQNSTGLAAKFIGGSGVEIDKKLVVNSGGAEISGKLNAKDNVEIANKLVVKAGGAEINGKLDLMGNAEITGDMKVGKRIRDQSGFVMPVGTVVSFAGTSAPEGWLLCNGQRVNGEQYRELAKVLFGEERNLFDIPDYRERFMVGATGSGDYRLGSSGGHAFVALTESQMPQHTHSVNDPGHTHSYQRTNNGTWHRYSGGGTGSRNDNSFDHPQTGSEKTGITLSSVGNSNAHENRPPFIALNYIIKY